MVNCVASVALTNAPSVTSALPILPAIGATTRAYPRFSSAVWSAAFVASNSASFWPSVATA